MSLIKCPECHKKISSETEKCVHCGATITKEYAENAEVVPVHGFAKPKWLTKKVTIILSIVCGLFVVVFGGYNIYRQIVIARFKPVVTEYTSDCLSRDKSVSLSYKSIDKLCSIETIYRIMPSKDYEKFYAEVIEEYQTNPHYAVVCHMEGGDYWQEELCVLEIIYKSDSKEYTCTGGIPYHKSIQATYSTFADFLLFTQLI